MGEVTLALPDILGSPQSVERLMALTAGARSGVRLTLDLGVVSWVCPFGAVQLLGSCRNWAALSCRPVVLSNLQEEVHAYLRRIDFFKAAAGAVIVAQPLDSEKDFGRSSASLNVLELFPIRSLAAVYQATNRARLIMDAWLGLGLGQGEVDLIVSLIAEACSNVVVHSGDEGLLTVQKYDHGSYADVHLAISDLGAGIPATLTKTHGPIATSCSDYIQRALDGLTSRGEGLMGQGLGAIRSIATRSGGSLHIRSETGSVTARPGQTSREDGLSLFPGTQIAIVFRSRSRTAGPP